MNTFAVTEQNYRRWEKELFEFGIIYLYAVLQSYLAQLQVTKHLIVENRDALALDKDQLYSLVQKTLDVIKGCALASKEVCRLRRPRSAHKMCLTVGSKDDADKILDS